MNTITRIPSHVRKAADEGMKAGFRQFASAASKAGLPQVAEMWEEYAPLSQKARFTLYCANFGPMVEGLGGKVTTRAAVVEDRTQDELQLLLEEAARLQKVIDALTAKPKVEKRGTIARIKRSTDRSKPKAKVAMSETTFGAGVVKSLRIPTKVGKAFTYKGKRSTSNWVVAAVKSDGSVVATRA